MAQENEARFRHQGGNVAGDDLDHRSDPAWTLPNVASVDGNRWSHGGLLIHTHEGSLRLSKARAHRTMPPSVSGVDAASMLGFCGLLVEGTMNHAPRSLRHFPTYQWVVCMFFTLCSLSAPPAQAAKRTRSNGPQQPPEAEVRRSVAGPVAPIPSYRKRNRKSLLPFVWRKPIGLEPLLMTSPSVRWVRCGRWVGQCFGPSSAASGSRRP